MILTWLSDVFCYFNMCIKILEGKYGPLVQTTGIVLFVLIFNFIIKSLLVTLRNRLESRNYILAGSIVAALPKPLNFLVWYIAAICTVDTISSGFFDLHLTDIHAVLNVGLVTAFAWFLLRFNKKLCSSLLEVNNRRHLHMTAGKLDALSKLATICIIFITIFLLMDVTGRNMQTLIAFAGIGSLALAFASQQMIANFFGGLMIYITHPFTIGEWIYLPERKIEGHVEEIGWYLTRIRNFEKRPIYVPNSVFTQTIVITPSRMSHERFHHTVGLRYRDIDVLKAIVDDIKLMLLKHPGIDQHLNVDVFFIGFGPSTLDIDISAYMSKTGGANFSALKQDLFFKIADIIKQRGGEFATPTNIIEIQGGYLFKNRQTLPLEEPFRSESKSEEETSR